MIVNEIDNAENKFRGNLPAFRGIGSVVKKKVKQKNDIDNIDKIQADAKRQNALAEKWKTLQNQKYTIANALKGESSNKKIIFDEYGDQQECKESGTKLSKKKISLFDDDDANEPENQELVSDYKLKLRFEGEKGKKLFHMQTSKATGDDRFVMDQRFFNDQELTEKMSDDEIEKQMNILEDVVGRAVSKPRKNNEDQIFNMVRYDPTQEEHKKYEQDKHELPKQKRVSKKQKQKVQQQQSKEPVIDTDKYYKVEDKLKDVFSSQSQFSLTNLFHTSDKSSDKLEQDDYEAEKMSNPQKKFGQNPFIDDSSDSEEENIHEDNVDNFDDKVASEKILGSRGVWREVFFFKVDDSRFKGTNTYIIVLQCVFNCKGNTKI
ncbi:Hypothetical protein CINCED_3A014458 [Cinara cedri]|uniref:Uncharacterized protein n=1 Tax=Cinara cedri TaxID=506608 RepID=A0A5E4MI08_9HEMI|nr:Hypothetical protein CINCED_3A014458 [Cinara cedri]